MAYTILNTKEILPISCSLKGSSLKFHIQFSQKNLSNCMLHLFSNMNRLNSTLITLFLSLSMLAQEKPVFSYLSMPYLQNMNNTEVSIISIASAPCLSYVQLGESKADLNQRFFASKHGQIEANTEVQKIRISDLVPGKTYYYQVVSKEIKVYQAYKVEYGDSIVSPLKSFTLPTSNKASFSFLAFNDVHSRPEYIDEIYKKNRDVDFICYNGDILDDIYSTDEIINRFSAPAARIFGGEIPFVYTRGNHETRGPAARELSRYVDTPNGEYYYSFVWGNTIFLVLDTGEDKPDNHPVYAGLADYDAYRSQQAAWVKQVVSSKAWKRASHRIVCGHIPASLENDGWHGSTEIEQKILPILNKAGVDLYLAGHTHEPKLEKSGLNHNFCLAVGGGPASENGNATYIRVNVQDKHVHVAIYSREGKLLNEYQQ